MYNWSWLCWFTHAVEFAKKFKTVGYDINDSRVNELNSGKDSTLEIDSKNLNEVLSLVTKK